MKTTIKQIHQTAKSLNKPLLMNETINAYYPIIYDSDGEESTINFVDDYLLEHTLFDDYAKFQYGQRMYDCDGDTFTSVYNDWIEECNSIVAIHLTSWARLYYALSLSYNPLWNVDGTEKEIYSEELTTNVFGSDKNTTVYGTDKSTNVFGTDKSTNVIANRSNESTEYGMSYDTNTEHKSGRTSDTIGGGTDTTTRDSRTDTNTRDSHTDTNTRDSRTDTSNVGEHTITKIRGGNIGVTETTALLNHEWEFRRKDFFKEIIETIIRETGADYDE